MMVKEMKCKTCNAKFDIWTGHDEVQKCPECHSTNIVVVPSAVNLNPRTVK